MEQYNEYCNRHETLTMKNYELYRDEIELIQILIDEYERRTIDSPVDINPVELLSGLLEDHGLSKSQLAKDLKVSKQLITDILNYRRNISKTMVNKLSQKFRLKQIAFSRPYELRATGNEKVRQTG